MTLEELRVLLLLEKDEQRESHLIDISRRLEVDLPENLFPPKVRIMSMHGAKGLSSQIVFIPGLEEEILPGQDVDDIPGWCSKRRGCCTSRSLEQGSWPC